MKPCSWCCRQTCSNVILLCFMLWEEVFLRNFKDTHCLLWHALIMKVLVAVSLVPALHNGVLFQKPVTNYAADIALWYDKICSVLGGYSIKTKYRKRLAVFLHGCAKGNSVYGRASQYVLMTFSLHAPTFHPLTQSQISATKLRTRVVRTFEACRGSIGR
jgi:hypothetical protein